MEILKEISKDKLIIMVTHNPELAMQYSSRIIKILDGRITDDSNPVDMNANEIYNEVDTNRYRRTSMKFHTAVRLSLNNLMTKKGRTILTSFAGSIGIIGIALILSLSSGVQDYITRVQEETLTSYPLTIEENSIDLTAAMSAHMETEVKAKEKREDDGKIHSNNTITDTLSIMSSKVQSNNLKQFKKYIEGNSSKIKDYVTAIGYEYNLDLQLYKSDIDKEIVKVNPNTVLESVGIPTSYMGMNMMMGEVWSELFENDEINNKMYQIVSGRMPEKYNEVVILVDENNKISDYVLYALGVKDQKELEAMYKKIGEGEKVETKEESYTYEELLNLSYKLLLNTDYYERINNIWVDKSEDENFLREKLKKAEEIRVVGIVKPKEGWTGNNSELGGILYTNDLEKYVIQKINDSYIVKEQKGRPNVNVITGLEFSKDEFSMDKLSDEQKMYLQSLPPEQLATIIASYKEQAEATYESTLLKLGSVDLTKPSAINIYANDFQAKEEVKKIIEDYNERQRKSGKEGNVITYSDLVGMLMTSVTAIVDMISYVLIAFVSISLVVSSIMIGIITYISVLERTKEIGILRAIGASKKDISRVFNAETLIVGLVAGGLGIGITLLLNIPINMVIENLANVSNISSLPPVGGALLVLISVVLTMVAGLIPAKFASKKDPVEALRTE